MKSITLKVDGKAYSQEAPLGQSLQAFLRGSGLSEVPQMLLDGKGERVVPQYTLVHAVQDKEFLTLSSLSWSEAVPALVAEELLSPASTGL